MWNYRQSTGVLAQYFASVATGYSGRGVGLNNPCMQQTRAVGPLPRGLYTVLPPAAHPDLGPLAMALEPDERNEMFGRSGFFLHGDNAGMNHTASDGCIVLDRATRERVAAAVAAGENRLEVVA